MPTTTSSATSTTNATARPPLLAWRTVDLVTAVMVGVAFGVAYWGWAFAYNGISLALAAFAPLSGLIVGPWLLAGTVSGLIVRRPGAALLAELVAANVEYLIGNEWGASTMIAGFLQGLGIEIALALFAYRRFGWAVVALGGVLSAVLESAYEWHAYFTYWDWAYKLAYLACFALSAAVVAGIGGWLLVSDPAERRVLTELAASPDPNRRRTAITATFWLVRHGETTDALAIADRLVDDPEVLVRNSVAVALREVGRIDASQRDEFLAAHAHRVSAPVRRVALS